MDELFYCTECLKLATDPVQIECQHTFCKACAEQLMDISYILTLKRDVFQCTVCSSQTRLRESVPSASLGTY